MPRVLRLPVLQAAGAVDAAVPGLGAADGAGVGVGVHALSAATRLLSPSAKMRARG